MNSVLGYCGVDCAECPAYKFQRKDDPAARRTAAAEWSKTFGADIKPEQMFCVGCASGGEPHVEYCGVCGIRSCATKRDVATCAECRDYGCETLAEFHKQAPKARENLEARRGCTS